MNIGIDFRMGGSVHGGIGRYVFELLKATLLLDPENRYVIFYNENTADAKDLAMLREKKNVILVATNIRHYSIAEQVRFPKILDSHGLDLMHFPNFNVPVRYKGPFVVTIHDMVHHRISGHKKSRLLHFKAYKYIIDKAVRHAAKIIAPSIAAKDDIAHYFPTATNKIEVIYEGSTLEPQPEEAVAAVKKTFLLTRPYFLFVGTLERKKNIVGLSRGFDEFVKNHKLDMDLVFAGKTDKHYPDEKYKAMDIKARDRLVFTGYVEDRVLAALYQGAYAFASASQNEGFGLPGVEAMQFGLPLLVSNSAVFNEIYDSAALYFDAGSPADIAEKMRLIASDKQFYELQRQKSLNRGALFSWDKAARDTLEIYRKVGRQGPASMQSFKQVIPED